MSKSLEPIKPGTTRVVRKFAWLPKNAVYVDPYDSEKDLSHWQLWLETYYERQAWDGGQWEFVRNEVDNSIFY